MRLPPRASRAPLPLARVPPSPSPGLRAACPPRDVPGVPEEGPAPARRDHGGAAARAPAYGHHHRQLLRRELLHHQQQLRLRPRVPPHRARAPHRGGDRECLAGGGGEAEAQTDPSVCSWAAGQLGSADRLPGNPCCSASPSSPSAKLRPPLPTRSSRFGLCWVRGS